MFKSSPSATDHGESRFRSKGCPTASSYVQSRISVCTVLLHLLSINIYIYIIIYQVHYIYICNWTVYIYIYSELFISYLYNSIHIYKTSIISMWSKIQNRHLVSSSTAFQRHCMQGAHQAEAADKVFFGSNFAPKFNRKKKHRNKNRSFSFTNFQPGKMCQLLIFRSQSVPSSCQRPVGRLLLQEAAAEFTGLAKRRMRKLRDAIQCRYMHAACMLMKSNCGKLNFSQNV